MGLGGISIWQLLIVLVIVILLFGTKRLRGLGGDLGAALRSFKKAVKEGDEEDHLQPDAPEALAEADKAGAEKAKSESQDKV